MVLIIILKNHILEALDYIKEKKMKCLGNLRVHPCAKIEDMNILNETTRIIFFPPNNKITLGVSEIENISQSKIPIIASLQLKEANQNEVKVYLKIKIAENAIGKFEYFYITIPLKHFGTIVDTKIMVQVGEVSLVNNKTSLLWDLQNKVFDSTIVLSGTVFFSPKKESKIKENSKDNFTIWNDIYITPLKIIEQTHIDWYDQTIESGVWYKYVIQKADSSGMRLGSLNLAEERTIKNNNGEIIKKTYNQTMMIFDDMFLIAEGKQLKIIILLLAL